MLVNDKLYVVMWFVYKLDFCGLSVVLDIVCLSLFVVVYYVCNSLFMYESDVVLVGGCCVILVLE